LDAHDVSARNEVTDQFSSGLWNTTAFRFSTLFQSTICKCQ
jgi:hypothetical protein